MGIVISRSTNCLTYLWVCLDEVLLKWFESFRDIPIKNFWYMVRCRSTLPKIPYNMNIKLIHVLQFRCVSKYFVLFDEWSFLYISLVGFSCYSNTKKHQNSACKLTKIQNNRKSISDQVFVANDVEKFLRIGYSVHLRNQYVLIVS